MNVVELLQKRAADCPDRDAITDLTGPRERTLTYGQLEHAAANAAAVFARAGLMPGARILVLHPMNASLYVALAGMLHAGLVPIVCDPGAGREQFNRACASVLPEAVFASITGHMYVATLPALTRVPLRFGAASFPGTIDVTRRLTTSAHVPREDDDAALITFTSGSTSAPKAIVRTHGLLRAQLEAIQATLPLQGVEVVTMPIVLLANLAAGATSVIPGADLRRPGEVDGCRIARDLERTSATSIVASPALIERLTDVDSTQLRTLRRIVTGGGPVMPALIDTLARRLPNAQVFAVYGSSEAEPIASLPCNSISNADVEQMRRGLGLLAGSPVPHSSVRILDGEIIVSGDHVVPGYLHGVGDEETKLRIDGRIWHRTGDGGYFDEYGRLWLTGRVKAVIRDSNGIIEPFRVECALSLERCIARSALVGVSGRRVLLVEPRRRAHMDTHALKRRLSWAHIDEVRVVRRLPVDRRHNAKIDYEALRKHIA